MPPPPRATGPGRASAATHESYSLASYNDEFREHPDIVMTRAVDAEFMDMFDLGQSEASPLAALDQCSHEAWKAWLHAS